MANSDSEMRKFEPCRPSQPVRLYRAFESTLARAWSKLYPFEKENPWECSLEAPVL